MDRPVKKPAAPDYAELARAILSPAHAIEGSRTTAASAAKALDLLGTLENVARESFTQARPPKVDPKSEAQLAARAALNRALRKNPPAAPSAIPQAATQPAAVPAPVFSSKRPEYQAALQDRGVIEALLDFHRKAQASPSEQKTPGAFVVPDLAKVEAQPKQRGLGARRTPGIAYPVLRPPRSDS